MENENKPKITIDIQARITIEGAEPYLSFFKHLANSVTVQTVPAIPVQEPVELLQPQKPVALPKANEQRYGDKSMKMISQKQVNLLNSLSNERHFSLKDVCNQYGVSDISQLNQLQMQEVFEKYKRV